jgi:hypothetical protein
VEDTVRALSVPELAVEAGPELVVPAPPAREPATQAQLFGGSRAISAAG